MQITNVKNHNYHIRPLGSEMVVCKMRLRVKNALLHKLGFVQPPYFCNPCPPHVRETTDQPSVVIMCQQTSRKRRHKNEVKQRPKSTSNFFTVVIVIIAIVVIVYRVALKSKPLPNDQKIALNRIPPVSEIRFLRQIKYASITIFVDIKYSVRDLLSDLNNYA